MPVHPALPRRQIPLGARAQVHQRPVPVPALPRLARVTQAPPELQGREMPRVRPRAVGYAQTTLAHAHAAAADAGRAQRQAHAHGRPVYAHRPARRAGQGERRHEAPGGRGYLADGVLHPRRGSHAPRVAETVGDGQPGGERSAHVRAAPRRRG